jgi:L,D-peptidoglycan transpeptidase YkuD (ErfK/YbiS/YcfS/YnhG family)
MNGNVTINSIFDSEAINKVLLNLQSQQAIVVILKKEYHADLQLYEWTSGRWQLIDQMQANIGKNGMGKIKEGDQKSPTGIFTLGSAFGNAPLPEEIKYPYRILTKQDYWVDDSKSRYYNLWVEHKKDKKKEWNSAEWLWQETICYKYAVIINYNLVRQPEKGSAIFLHIWVDENSPTHGCTAVSEENMVRILKWLVFDKKPVIIQGTYNDILSIIKEQIIPIYQV